MPPLTENLRFEKISCFVSTCEAASQLAAQQPAKPRQDLSTLLNRSCDAASPHSRRRAFL